MSKKKKDKNVLSLNDNVDEIGFEENPKVQGDSIAEFSFDSVNENEENKKVVVSAAGQAPGVITQYAEVRESKTYKRSYMLTKECIRKIDELKANHPSLTTYVSDIVEIAINEYYDKVFKK